MSDDWRVLKDVTDARVALGTAGRSITTRDHLAFQLAHAKARDAVGAALDVAALVEQLRRGNEAPIAVRSRAPNHKTYLSRPDLGRLLDDDSTHRLAELASCFDIVFVVADGLSARAATDGARALLDAVLPLFNADGWRVAPIVVAANARVALGDAVARILGAEVTVIMLGERPGLSAADSLGLYVTWKPRENHIDAERNCISNVRPGGLSYVDAAPALFRLCREAKQRRITGTALKSDGP